MREGDIFLRGAQVWWDELFLILDQKCGRLQSEQLAGDKYIAD